MTSESSQKTLARLSRRTFLFTSCFAAVYVFYSPVALQLFFFIDFHFSYLRVSIQ